jgi:hypothetical protein
MRKQRSPLQGGLGPSVGAALLVLAAACGDDDTDTAAPEGDGSQCTPSSAVSVDEVQTFEVTSNDHTDRVVCYPQAPPVGGKHAPRWQNCGFYDGPIFNETGVHSLEHGAIWVTFRPNLAADQVEQVRALAEQPHVLASPWEDDSLGAPIVLSAWGAQLGLETLPSPLADEFVSTYRQAGTAPEPDAPCTDGVDQTRAELTE